MLKSLTMTALLITAMPAFPASARDVPAAPTARVKTADLDLSSATGRQTLDRRIRVAIDQVCANADAAPRAGLFPTNHCRQSATAGAKRQRRDLIAALDARKNGKAGVELAAANTRQ